MRVRFDAGIGSEIADHELDRIKGRMGDRRDAGIRAVQRVAHVAVIGARALTESGVASLKGSLVEFGNRRFERSSLDADLRRKRRQRRAALEVAAANMASDRQREGRHAAEAISAQGAMIANQKNRDFLARL